MGESPCILQVTSQQSTIKIKLLTITQCSNQSFLLVVMHGHLDTVKILTRGSSQQMLNEEDNCGSTPLMDACRFGFPDIAQFLIDECSVNPSSVNKNGVGLLHVSAEADQSEMIRVLVEKYKLDLNLQSHLLSFTPLHWAARVKLELRLIFMMHITVQIRILLFVYHYCHSIGRKHFCSENFDIAGS